MVLSTVECVNEYSPLHTCAQIHYSNEGMHLIARIAALHPVSFNPFSRIRITVSFNCSCVGDSEGSHLRRACTKKPWKVIHF